MMSWWSADNKEDPTTIAHGNQKKYLWTCPVKTACGCSHVFPESPNNMYKGRGCPFCAHKQICCAQESLACGKFPDLIAQWSDERNPDMKPGAVTPFSNRKVWWTCNKICVDSPDCKHDWQAYIQHRHKAGCPFCSGKKVCCVKGSLAGGQYDDIVKEWHPTKNMPTQPSDVRYGSDKRITWTCSKCQQEWSTQLSDRTINGHGCPRCNDSHMEKAMRKVLEKLKLVSTPQHPLVCPQSKRTLKLDFLVTLDHDQTFGIEMDGSQHFDPNHYFYTKKTLTFAKQQDRDQLKKQLCRAKALPLLRISYSVDPSTYSQIIQDFIQRVQEHKVLFETRGPEYDVTIQV